MLDAVHTLLSEIWKSHLGSPELSDYALSENTEGILYESHGSHISDWRLGT